MTPLDHDASGGTETGASRPNRMPVMAFVTDAETEFTLREGLEQVVPEKFEFRRVGIRGATALLATMPTPLTLILDLSGEENPLAALADLSQVVEPDVRVLVVGDQDDVNFYRQVTRGLGALEYLSKPLTRDLVARQFGPLLNRQSQPQSSVLGGRLVTITGSRGGVGASTIAANLGWYLGAEAKRHTVVLDTDLHRGVCAMLLGSKTGSGLRTALEAPGRIDELFVERVSLPVADRLHVLAGEERLADQPTYTAGAGAKLSDALRRRYNFVVADLPFTGQPLHRDLLHLAHQRVLVMVPTLASIRDTLRLLAIPNGPAQPRRAVVLLNRSNMQGGLELRRVTDALKMKPDIVIPEVRRSVERAASLGTPVAKERGPVRSAMAALAREVGFMSREPDAKPSRRLSLPWRK
jgi:pilus assembly protein CpaE